MIKERDYIFLHIFVLPPPLAVSLLHPINVIDRLIARSQAALAIAIMNRYLQTVSRRLLCSLPCSIDIVITSINKK